MNFISWAFVFLFIPIFLARHLFGRQKTERPFLTMVMAASTIFVLWHVPAYLVILLVSIGVDYVAAIGIDRQPVGSARRKWFLILSLSVNLALLAFFKYSNFALASVEGLVHCFGRHAAVPRLDLILPMGISFYTFGSMSYTIDVYRGRLQPKQRFRDFYFFITFFPHLVAGPIIRAEQFFYQMPRTRRPWLRVFNEGAFLIIRGAFLKMVCADNIARAVNSTWNSGYSPGANSTDLIVATLLFATQIFCDFEGYSSIARGLAYWMGYRFPLNFNNPYIAASFSNFWERWHITLSRWLRDYLYVPLGGNRVGKVRTYVNLVIVMVLGGLWHGASWTFVMWGTLHGAALALERLLGLNRLNEQRGQSVLKTLWYGVVLTVVMVSWIFFRSDTLAGALRFLANIAHMNLGEPTRPLLMACLFVLPVIVMHLHGWLVEQGKLRPIRPLAKAALAAFMLYATLVCYGQTSEFIYFQF